LLPEKEGKFINATDVVLKLKYYEAKYEHRVLNFKLRGVQSNYAKRNFLKELVCLFVLTLEFVNVPHLYLSHHF